jgi:PRTRC genetic system protein B
MFAEITMGSEAHRVWQPLVVLVVYDGGSGRQAATVHDVIRENGGEPITGPGRPLGREALNDLVKGLAGKTAAARRIVPAHVLVTDADCLVWWRPSVRRPIFFNTSDKEFNEAVNAQPVLHPALLFVARENLSVWALAENRRPEATTPVLRAPYCNLYEGGNMCSGAVRLPGSCAISTIEAWESAFYDTTFTHSNLHGSPLTSHPGGDRGLWRDMLGVQPLGEDGVERFPIEHLVAIGKTVEGVVK